MVLAGAAATGDKGVHACECGDSGASSKIFVDLAHLMHTWRVILLRFRLENFRSARDEIELNLAHAEPPSRTSPLSRWVGCTTRAAAIYGANASGKSTLVNGLKYFRSTLMHSATSWVGRNRGIPFEPFALDQESKGKPSGFSVDFVHDGTRYEYGFTTRSGDVLEEWLSSFPEGRERSLFTREKVGETDSYSFGPSFRGGSASLVKSTQRDQLVLSRAAVEYHSTLAPLYMALVEGLVITEFHEHDRTRRLEAITESIEEGVIDVTDVIGLLRVADVGISDLKVNLETMPEEVQRMMRSLFKNINSGDEEERESGESELVQDSPSVSIQMDEKFWEQRRFEFMHHGPDGAAYPLSQRVQSTGTLAWLSLAVPALEALRGGKVLVVDELDASLHPRLAYAMLEMFRDAAVNKSGAQIIFTTHDTYFLSNSSELPLSENEVWFVDKHKGVTSVYPLSDFSNRRDDNVAKRYLQGRYGALPSVIPALVSQLTASENEE